MNIITNSHERTRFLKFAMVGLIGAIVDFTFFNLSRWLGASIQVSGTVGFSIAVLSNFLLNRFWTYPDSRSKAIWRQFLSFLLINLVGLGIRIGILSFLPEWVEIFLRWTNINFPIVSLTINFFADNLSVAVSIGIVMFWNFFINRYWTYNDVESRNSKEEETQ